VLNQTHLNVPRRCPRRLIHTNSVTSATCAPLLPLLPSPLFPILHQTDQTVLLALKMMMGTLHKLDDKVVGSRISDIGDLSGFRGLGFRV